MDKETGGPAFPGMEVTEYGSGPRVDHFPGMTLRDYFAAKAMQGAAASEIIYNSPEQAAQDAYKMADAMMSERAK